MRGLRVADFRLPIEIVLREAADLKIPKRQSAMSSSGHGSQITIVHVALIVDAEYLGSDKITSRHILRIQRLTSNRHYLELYRSCGQENANADPACFSTESLIDL